MVQVKATNESEESGNQKYQAAAFKSQKIQQK
jgi:hypothetical protein